MRATESRGPRVNAKKRTWVSVAMGAAVVLAGCATDVQPAREGTAKTSQAIAGAPHAPGEWSQVVQLSGGGSACTGTLISPRLVLTASHCFGIGPNNGPQRGIHDGLSSCWIEDAFGSEVGTGGCGTVSFRHADGVAREAFVSEAQPYAFPETVNVVHVWVNAPNAAHTNNFDRGAGDLAIALLDRRATPDTRANAVSTRPFLDLSPIDEVWSIGPTTYAGWGFVDSIPHDCPLVLRDQVGAVQLSVDASKRLGGGGSDPPVRSTSASGHSLGGTMFAAYFDLCGDLTGLVEHGDSGGPLFKLFTDPNFPGVEQLRVIGVTSRLSCDVSCSILGATALNLWARTMSSDVVVAGKSNRQFLMDHIFGTAGNLRGLNREPSLFGEDFHGLCGAGTEDPDCDGVPNHGTANEYADERDNCPDDWNPDQRDEDGDGIGNACDTCPSNVNDGSNTNAEGECVYWGSCRQAIRIPGPFPTWDDIDRKIADNASKFPADGCDSWAVNAPAHGLRSRLGIQSDGEFNGVESGRLGTCYANGRPFPCPTVSTALISFRPFVRTFASLQGTESWKRCHCLTPDDGLACDQPFFCPRDGSIFDSPDFTGWRLMTIEGELPGTHDVNESIGLAPFRGQQLAPSYDRRWLWWHDLGGGLPPPPGPGGVNLNVGATLGRVWWFISSQNDERTSPRFGNQALRNSVYTTIEVDEISKAFGRSMPLPPGRGTFGSSFLCLSCPSETWLTTIASVGSSAGVLAFPSNNAAPSVDLTSQFSSDALAALTDVAAGRATLLTAGETPYRLASGDATHVLLNDDSRIGLAFAADPHSGNVDVLRFHIGPSADPPTLGPGVAVALSGRRNALMAAGRLDGALPGTPTLWIGDATSAQWTAVPIVSGPEPDHVHGLTAVDGEGVFYAIDETRRHGHSRVRLLRITPTGSVQQIASWKKEGRHATFTIVGAYGGGLLVSSSSGDDHTLALVQLSGLSISSVSVAEGEGAIAVAPFPMREGVAWGELKRGVLYARTTLYSKFRNRHHREEEERWF